MSGRGLNFGRNQTQSGKPVNTGQKINASLPGKAVPKVSSDLQKFKNDYEKLSGQQNTTIANSDVIKKVINELKRYGFKIHGGTKDYDAILDTMKNQITNNSLKKNVINLTTISGIINTLKNQGIIKTNNRVGIPINIFITNYGITNNRIINYIIKRKISSKESIEILKKTINLLSYILKDKKYKLDKIDQLKKYIENKKSKYPKGLLTLTFSYIYNIRRYIKHKRGNIIEKVLYILDHINISDLSAYNDRLIKVKLQKNNLLICTIDFIINRLKKLQINRPIAQHVLGTKKESKQTYNEIRERKMSNTTRKKLIIEKKRQGKNKNEIQREIEHTVKGANNLNRLYNKVNKNNIKTLGKALNININANEFYLMMARDMIHDTDDKFKEQLYVDNFGKIFSNIVNNVLQVRFTDKSDEKGNKKSDLDILKNKLENIKGKTKDSKGKTKDSPKDSVITYVKKNNENKIKENLSKMLQDKVDTGNGLMIPISESGITWGNSKNLVSYKFKGNKTKYYKKFDILINANTQNKSNGGNITKFLRDLYKTSNNTPIMSKVITLSQLSNKGIDFIVNPVNKFHDFLNKKNEIGKEYKVDEKCMNVFINLMNDKNKKIGSFRISNQFDMKSKKFYIALNGKRINVVSKAEAGKSSENKLGKFLGDFSMILKVIHENKMNKDKNTAFGTFDKNGALTFIKLSHLAKIKPRLFFVEYNPRSLYIIGMNDIISRRLTETIDNNRTIRNRTIATENRSKYVTGSVNTSIPSTSTLGKVKSKGVNNSKTITNKLLKKAQNNFQKILNNKVKPPKAPYPKITLSKPPNKPINLRNNDPNTVLNYNSSSNYNTSRKRSASPKKSPPGSKRQKLQTNIRKFLLPKS